ncbi:hypothetical protein BH10ACI3_BH10ACI3_22490 [soil metagenome]
MRKLEVRSQKSEAGSSVSRRLALSWRLARVFSSAFILLLTAHCLLLTANAQGTGGLKGKVRNMRGELLTGATVTARQNSKDLKTTRTNDRGEFVLNGLDAGTYNIAFEAKGYSAGIKFGVEVKQNKTYDLGDRLILEVDRGSQIIVKGSVFFKDSTSVTGAKVDVERVNADGSVKKLGSAMTNIYGEFVFRQPDVAAKYRITARFRGATANKELDVSAAAIYTVAISLDISRDDK